MANLKSLAHNVKIETEYWGVPRNIDFPNSTPWKITLKYKGRQLTTPFYTGSAITEEPTSYDVLYCLISDAYAEDEDFYLWASDLGYDPVSRKAEKVYNQCVSQTKKLRQLLGSDYETFKYSEQD